MCVCLFVCVCACACTCVCVMTFNCLSCSMFSLGGQLVVATGYGVLHRMTWEGKLIVPMSIHLDQIPFVNDTLTAGKGLLIMEELKYSHSLSLPPPSTPHSLPLSLLTETESCVVDVCYSPELHGMSVVVASGKGAFLTSRSARFEPNVWSHTHTHTHTHTHRILYLLL